MVLLSFISVVVSFLLAMLIVRRMRGHAGRYGKAKPQRFHLGDVPRLGGAAMFGGLALGWLAGAAAYLAGNRGLLGITPAVAMTWIVVLLPALAGGVVEDLTQRLPVRFRLVLTGLSGSLAIMLLDVGVPRLGTAMLDAWMTAWPWAGYLVALLAITGLPHAFNIIDGYNGLSGMVAIVVCLALTYVAFQVGDRQLAVILICVASATAGFLAWNYPRGMLFAGDGGAYLWGICIAVASLLLVKRHDMVSPWFPVLLLIYPVWETLFSIYRKVSRGVSPSVADALHFHQLIYRRVVHRVFHDDESRRILMRNNRTSPYLWTFTMLTVMPALLFWRSTPVLIAFCALFVLSYVTAYLMIVRFKVPAWMRH